MPDQLVTPAQVKARVEVTDVADDALITELIEQVSDYVQDFTGRRFLPEDNATYVVDTAAGAVIQVPRGIRAVDSIAIATTDQPDTGGTYGAALAAGLVVVRPSPIDRRPGWPGTRIELRGTIGPLASVLNGATITGDFGFAAVPPSIQGVVIDAVVAAFTDRQAGASNVIGADRAAVFPWSTYFGAGSAQTRTLERFRAGYNMGIG